MKFARVPLHDAEGHILGHNVSHEGRRVLKKGRVLGRSELRELLAARHEQVYVAMLEAADVTEDAAALRIANAIAAPGQLRVKPAYGGRVTLQAAEHGLLGVEPARLLELNLLEGVTLATLPAHSVVAPGRSLATLKVIPFALPEATVRAAEVLGALGVLSFRALGQRRVTILVSGAESRRERLYEAYRKPLGERLSSLGSHTLRALYVALGEDPERELAAAIAAELDAGTDLLIAVGETATMDVDDLTPRAIVRAGGRVDVVGAPVFPGNLLLLGERGPTLILGAPGCVRSRATNIVDLLLPRLLLGDRLSRRDIAALGQGGLLADSGSSATEGAGEASEDG
jgi:molybdenum cofactor cytidylyltransferase